MHRRSSPLLALCLAVCCACTTNEVARIEPQPGGELRKSIPAQVRRDLDLLFVSDNSGSMADEQESLAKNFARFTNVLSSIEGGLPSVHIGVISTDLGVGVEGDDSCSASGDGGALQTSGCTAIRDGKPFIEDLVQSDGSRVKNYEGTLEEAFSCMARLGDQGCRFEQPLESMRKALDHHPLNAAFLRPDAYLAVIFITDEDDCSVWNPEVFSPSQNSIDAPLGNLSSFRCFEYGVRCDPDTPRVPGLRQGCESRADSPYLHDVREYVDFLYSIKEDPGLVMVAGIMGNPTPVSVAVVTNMQGKAEALLEPSCRSGAGEADPAIRLHELIESFPQRGLATTICNEDLSDSLELIADLYVKIGFPCVTGIADLDPEMPGVQYDCTASDVRSSGDDSLEEEVIPSCDLEATLPCWQILESELCESTPQESAFRFEVCRGGDAPELGCPPGEAPPAPTGTSAVLRCRSN